MPYPDRLLADEERVVKHLHPHWITLAWPTVLFLLIVGLTAFLAAIVPTGSAQQVLRVVIVAVAALALIVLVLVPYLRWRTTHYVLTTHRLMTRVGILNHSGRDVPLNRINNAMYEQSLWERIINSGTLMVESAGEDGQQVFRHVPEADRTQQLINRLVESDQDRRARDAARYEARYEARHETDNGPDYGPGYGPGYGAGYDADYERGRGDDPTQPFRRR